MRRFGREGLRHAIRNRVVVPGEEFAKGDVAAGRKQGAKLHEVGAGGF